MHIPEQQQQQKFKTFPVAFAIHLLLRNNPLLSQRVTQPHPQRRSALTKKWQYSTGRPENQGHAHAARALEYALGGDEDARSDDGADDDGDPPQQSDLLFQNHLLLPWWLLAPHGGQPPAHIALQVTSFGDGGHNWLSDHGSVTPGEGSERKNRGKTKQNKTFNFGFSRCDWSLLSLGYLFAFTDWLCTLMSTGETPEVCFSLPGCLIMPLFLGAPVWHRTGSRSSGFAAAAAAALSLHTSSASSWTPIYATACHTNLLGYNDDANSPGLHQPHEKAPAWESANITQLFLFFFFFNSSGVLLNWPKAFPWTKHTLKEGLSQSKRSKLATDLSWWLSATRLSERRENGKWNRKRLLHFKELLLNFNACIKMLYAQLFWQ